MASLNVYRSEVNWLTNTYSCCVGVSGVWVRRFADKLVQQIGSHEYSLVPDWNVNSKNTTDLKNVSGFLQLRRISEFCGLCCYVGKPDPWSPYCNADPRIPQLVIQIPALWSLIPPHFLLLIPDLVQFEDRFLRLRLFGSFAFRWTRSHRQASTALSQPMSIASSPVSSFIGK